ncbi:integral membrane protein TmpA [Diaporthe helianthi]|uniref:Integral membrane protein TmpA n=1 Tax=Diaporthe helianthi TaxID=158607 RepID=A0A2P5HGW1_DIAHE|nr:integral membrane protein TmpA [Diaporthe helianthi]
MDSKPGPTHTSRSIGETVESIPATAAPEKDHHAGYTSTTLSTLRYTVLNTYRRLFTIVLISNITALVVTLVRQRHMTDTINACAANLLACGLARQPLVVNALYFIFGLVPRSAPLRLRHLACKIFHIGGVHSGCGVASLIWYLGFVALYSYSYHIERSSNKSPGALSTAILAISWVVLLVFLFVIAVTYPGFRTRQHNVFELTHRFGGWAILALFWALLLIFATITDRFDSRDTKFSCVISRAGDWTTRIIENPPTKIWVRGVPITGFVYAMRVFSRIILVTTGSGIGPCLSFIEDEQRPSMRVVWQTRDPLATYGQRTLDLVQRLDHSPVILETKKGSGRIDMLPLVESLYMEFAAEAQTSIKAATLTEQKFLLAFCVCHTLGLDLVSGENLGKADVV